MDSGEIVDIILQKNGENIWESLNKSDYYGPSGYVDDQGMLSLILLTLTVYYIIGGRTVVLYLGLYDI